ncbi:nitrate reductase molybdenum cofactor assembly chaperone [Streptomyces sp. YIM S03343]
MENNQGALSAAPGGVAVRTARRLSPEETADRALLLRLLSLLLRRPDTGFAAARPVLVATVDALPPSPAAAGLAAFTGWLEEQEPGAPVRHHTEAFGPDGPDGTAGLRLTRYLDGDTRRREMALLTLAQRYRAAGWDIDDGEQPDHLPVMLEFAALTGPGKGEAPLRQHRRGLELVHHALTDAGSPYRHLLAALLALVPPPSGPEGGR